MTTTQPGTEARTGLDARRRSVHTTLWVLQIVTAVLFLVVAIAKFTGYQPIADIFDAIGFGDWFRYLIGALEVVGAVALVVPRLAGLAGLAFVGLMIGAILFQAFAVGSDVLLPVPFLVLSALIAWGRWPSVRQVGELLGRS